MSELICTCHCGGTMFYRHLHESRCACAAFGEEAPESEVVILRARVAELEQERESASPSQ